MEWTYCSLAAAQVQWQLLCWFNGERVYSAADKYPAKGRNCKRTGVIHARSFSQLEGIGKSALSWNFQLSKSSAMGLCFSLWRKRRRNFPRKKFNAFCVIFFFCCVFLYFGLLLTSSSSSWSSLLSASPRRSRHLHGMLGICFALCWALPVPSFSVRAV